MSDLDKQDVAAMEKARGKAVKSILVVTDKNSVYNAIKTCFRAEYRVDVVSDKETCLEHFRKNRYELTFLDIEMFQNGSDSGNGSTCCTTILKSLWQVFPTAEIVAMSSPEKLREAVLAVREGASNYITYPIHIEELRHVTESIYQSVLMRSELDYLRGKFWQNNLMEVVQTGNLKMKRVYERIRALAPTQTRVLLTGETGTGKSLMAKLIHRHSDRADAQFITVHCGAIPETLLETELFGYEKGAFTGADRRKLGKFEIAHKGTIFLDEIGTMPPSAQIKLLKVLQDKTFQRIGGEVDIEVDVRMIFATNADLKKMREEGLFRNDLYYRLSVFPVEIPPLRERVEDIPYLSILILKKLNKLNTKEIRDIDPRVLDAFKKYQWPGNIRELENLMERAYIIESSLVLTPESFPLDLFSQVNLDPDCGSGFYLTLSEFKRRTTEKYLTKLLALHKGRIRKASESAGISSRQLHKLMTKYGMNKKDFRSLSS